MSLHSIGHEITVLPTSDVEDVTVVELIDSLSLVRYTNLHDLWFFHSEFDLAFFTI